MADPETRQSFLRRRVGLLSLASVLLLGAVLYSANLRNNPPGFYIDESSISYNAQTIAQTGKDEHGVTLPLFFRAFGEYKNPIYIYLLAAVFRVTGPGILAARTLSAFLICAAALMLGLLAMRISGRRDVGLIVVVTALLTPWFFELGHVVLEVALYPLVLALFLLSVWRTTRLNNWSWLNAGLIAVTLALLTYSYSIGRLFAPLLAVGLLFFLPRASWFSIGRVWLLYALLLLPLLVFQWEHPQALMSRFHIVSYATNESSYPALAREFATHYVGNLNPWRMVVRGDPNNRQVAALYGTAPILAVTFFLALFGIVIAWREYRRDPWWRFIIFGLLVCAVPASLTKDYFHILRLAPLPVFLIVLSALTLKWLLAHRGRRAWRLAIAAAVILTLAQGALYQWQHHAYGRTAYRAQLFDADYPTTILPVALAQPARPIYLADAEPIPGYIQAFWYATLQSLPLSNFNRLAPEAAAPADSIVITTENIRPRCRELAQVQPYTVCRMQGQPQLQLAPRVMRAELHVPAAPSVARAGQKLSIRVSVKNLSDVTWFARERGAAPFQLNVGNHWLDQSGRELMHDDGRAPLPRNLAPGETLELELFVNAPRVAGTYILELDMLQEGVAWFATQGSNPVRMPIRIVSD
jgi:4-amino-4-deoxy-L-arabinose transferase-like glycosyltransferase